MKKSNPKVSVVMSVYNAEQFLREAIQSILNQDFNNFEFIIINDGSTDSSIKIIKRFAREDDRIVLIDQENTGLTRSLIRGILISKGELIARQDADDISMPDRLSQQIKYFETIPDIVLLGCNANIINQSGEKVRNAGYIASTDSEIREHLKYANTFIHTSVMFRKAAYLQAGGYNEQFKFSQDSDLWHRMCHLGKVQNINLPLVQNRVHKGAISENKLEEQVAYFAFTAQLFVNNIAPEKCNKLSKNIKKHTDLETILVENNFDTRHFYLCLFLRYLSLKKIGLAKQARKKTYSFVSAPRFRLKLLLAILPAPLLTWILKKFRS